MKRYLVTGGRGYRGHKQGAEFDAVLNPDTEARAIRLGAIRILETLEPGIRPGTYKPPRGWPTARRT